MNYQYRILEHISELYKSELDLHNVYILACQHILEPQAKMFNYLNDFGIPKENIHIFGKIYSTSNEVLTELKNQNFKVAIPSFHSHISFDIEHKQNCMHELNIFLASLEFPSKIIILDDGGELIKAVNDVFNSISKEVSIVGIEQTSSGFRKLEYEKLHFPVFNVARSAVKLTKESPLIANLGCNRIVDVINQYSIKEPRILIVGLGPIGNSLLSVLSDRSYFVLGYDVANGGRRELIDLVRNNNINIVVGATGVAIINENQIQEIKNTLDYSLYLISMSSADREFPTVYLRKNGIFSNEKIHSDIVWDNIVLINNGFPITFKGNRYESTPNEIERTIALLYGSTLEAIVSNMDSLTGFVEVPMKIVETIEQHS